MKRRSFRATALRTAEGEATCAGCGALHLVTYTYSSFSPANTEHETAKCKVCGVVLVRERCLGLQASLKL